MKLLKLLLVPLALASGLGFTPVNAQDLGRFFKNTEGAFVLYDLKNDRFTRYNDERCRRRFPPYSTFKVPNSLIGLETGVIKDEGFVIAWDRRKYPPQNWDREPFIHWSRDHNLRSAIKHSVVWYYRELALRVGEPAMKKYVADFQYGNQDISGGLDRFWLGNSLQISADEQVRFLKAFYGGELGLSKRTTDIVKEIIVLEATPSYRLSGKTGGGPLPGGKALGWFVGYVEKEGNVYFFATNLEGADYMAVRDARISLTRRILAELGLLHAR